MDENGVGRQHQGFSRRTYFAFTVGVIVIGWIIAAGNTGISYLALGTDAIPIITGTLGCVAFVVLLRLLHRAWWLAVVSVLPALLVLVGSVQYPLEAALGSRGVRTAVTVTADSAAGTGSSAHRFTVEGPDGPLEETLDYRGDNPTWKVGDRLVVVSDPEKTVSMVEASEVDSDGKFGMLLMGVIGWTCVTLLAGLRGFVRRREGRTVFYEG
ncbi:hypothetical protein [Streptomyces sp. NBC_01012]|uniref:hypothetical protein n=1 Tax=Streptomyces sp. NBC_01012 TaxID=2903717 RepID=UPI0038690665|nr:hypothetical protein OG623_23650 [Streptomyces sp. NBC_01012]